MLPPPPLPSVAANPNPSSQQVAASSSPAPSRQAPSPSIVEARPAVVIQRLSLSGSHHVFLHSSLHSATLFNSGLFKLLKNNSHILLYPGGQREALHYKGEEYKVIWPDHPEFVRMAARFGTTIVPFGTVGEDDIADILLDFNDLAKIPYFIEYVRELQRGLVKFKDEISGEVASRDIAPPLILPKLPGRFYYLFGKPISTKGIENMLKDREAANKLYLQIKSVVENNMGYLLKKRLRNRLAWMQNYQTYATGTSAAPTCLPALQFTNKDPKGNVHEFNLIDGGVCANNLKFDAVSRYSIEGGGLSFFSDIALLLIDEVHLLNDPRGAALEAIVSRIKIVSCNPKMKLNPLAQVRLVAVSATIPNIEDLAEWIKVLEEGIKRFGEEMRPVKLKTKVFDPRRLMTVLFEI
ncbi:hypothetical protein HN51_040146 [Arachis hypogaea]